ncbi:LytTR family two component transcriptional regulator [Aquimarina sp. MAR_2010_214]|uniref:LytR/AlgR family response regulator transcription factor n=1 Tax=Aquimarina sp. MAR_2010_214 TaxID=1250026 RepID=UPI000C70BE1E|nr:LytTR family DNA-binding domain-containing protein [Aquimarina sp. MAR_2010_214]PKV49985.1 LytTR family two component transcriptional regulator [Aquimarina sp. MAR_2010_214]
MNQIISAVIIEDEEEAFTYLKATLEKHFCNINIIGSSNNAKNAIDILNNLNPELVFMDIELPDGNAFQILDAINNYDFEVIFVTAHSNYIEKAIAYYAFNFLTKPIEVKQLINIIKRYIHLKKRLFTKQKYILLKEFLTESKLLIQTGNEHIAININDIIKSEADGNYSHFTMADKSTYLASKSLKYYENLLLEKGFFRANRSTLVNIEHIRSIYKKQALILSNKEKVIVSIRNKSKLSEIINYLS